MATGCSNDTPALPERSAGVSRLELFFDLVFVFTVTQLTGVLVDGGDGETLAQVVVMLLLIWWMYDGYAWLTNAIAPDHLRFGLFLIGGMGGFLVIALAVPNAYDGDGLALGLGYLVVVLLHAGMFVRGTSVSEVRAMLRIAPFNLIAVTLVLIGGSLGDDPQWILWALAGILLWFTPRVTTVEGFVVSVSHFVERHGLVVIVALGESIVVIGTGAAGLALDPGLVLVALLSLSLSAALWRIYFSDEEAVERALHGMAPQRRARPDGIRVLALRHPPRDRRRRGRPEEGDRPPLRPTGGLDRAGARGRRRPLHRLRHWLPADLRDCTQPHPAAGGGGGPGHNPARHPVCRGHPGRSDRGARHGRARSGMDSRQPTRELAIPFGFGRPRGPAIGLLAPQSERATARSVTPASDDQQACKVTLLLLGKGVVPAHRIERPFAARLDETEQRPRGDPGRVTAAPSTSGRLRCGRVASAPETCASVAA